MQKSSSYIWFRAIVVCYLLRQSKNHGTRIQNLNKKDFTTKSFVRYMLLKNRILLESIDDFTCDDLIQHLLLRGLREEAFQIATLLIPRMNLDRIEYSIRLLFFRDWDYDTRMHLAREFIQRSSKEEILSLLNITAIVSCDILSIPIGGLSQNYMFLVSKKMESKRF